MKTKEREVSRKIERRLAMIYAHTKRGKTVQEVIKEFGCWDTYYYGGITGMQKWAFSVYSIPTWPQNTT